MSLDRQTAHRALETAVDQARVLGRPICASITDDRGALMAFTRMDGAPVRSIRLSEAKAYTAARLGVATTTFHERLVREAMPASYFADPMLTGLPGGAVLHGHDGGVIGAIGISGLTPAEDQQIAENAADAARTRHD